VKRLLSSIAVSATVLAVGLAGTPVQARANSDATSETRVYLVVLRQAPVASYDGNIAGYPATTPSPGSRLDSDATAVLAYRGLLTRQQSEVLTGIGKPKELYSYTTALNGFAAALTPEQAKALEVDSRVLLVQPDAHVSVDGAQARVGAAAAPRLRNLDPATDTLWSQVGGPEQAGRGQVIGVIDTGVWPDNPSLAGIPIGAATPAKTYPGFTGVCQRGSGWTHATCNSKIIAARYFVSGFGRANVATSDYLSPRDGSGHGTSVAAIAAGNAGVDTRIGRQDFGHISGQAPGAALSIYKACWTAPDPSHDGCDLADTLKAIDQAVADGVDVINYSLGDAGAALAGPVQLAFLNATIANVFVSTPAGNAGPTAGSVQHSAPWVTTVGANTRDVFQGGLQLGSGGTVVGAMLSNRRVGPARLVYAGDVPASGVASHRAALCYPGSLDAQSVDDAIVVCDRGVTSRVSKSAAVARAGGRAMVLANTVAGSVNADLHRVPTVHLDVEAADRVKAYLAAAGSSATATVLPRATDHPVVPAIADFSGRGPSDAANGDLLKPDLTAPGVSVISAVAPPEGSGVAGGAPLWDVESGTSISAPHVAGVAAVVRAAHPTWSPAAVKSAMMTTAHALAEASDPLARGAGELDPARVLDPGLVYDTSASQWNAVRTDLRLLLGTVRGPSSPATASNLNSASLAVGDLVGPRTVRRTVTNVGDVAERYTASITGLSGIATSVTPHTLELAPGESGTFRVTFSATKSARYNTFATGSLMWRASAGQVVSSPVVVRPELASSPAEAAAANTAGSLRIDMLAGVTGTVRAFTSGLVGATPSTLALQPGAFDPHHPAESASTDAQTVVVPPGARAARFQVTSSDPGADMDLYLYHRGTLVASATGRSADETITLSPEPGAYRIFATSHGTATTTTVATLTNWVLPRSVPTALQLDRHVLRVDGGERFSVDTSWSALDPQQRWWGYVGVRNRPGVTYVTIN
jgi:hypothetical protein